MTNIIIASEMRVGSRWLHYLLKDLYRMKVSPEIGIHRVKNEKEDVLKKVKEYMSNDRIVKFHGLKPENLLKFLPKEEFGDYKVIFIVRNPRDRGISLAFHHKNEKGYDKWNDLTDKEAIERAFLDTKELKHGNEVMFETMKRENSLFYVIKKNKIKSSSYVWISYEWMIEDIFNQIVGINMYLEGGKKTFSNDEIDDAIMKNHFETKSGRELGKEDRKDTWRRKGIVGDWMNHFDGALFDSSKKDWDIYWRLVELGRNIPN